MPSAQIIDHGTHAKILGLMIALIRLELRAPSRPPHSLEPNTQEMHEFLDRHDPRRRR